MGGLRCVLLFIQQSLEPAQLALHVSVDLQVSRDDHFHLLHIVIDVAVLGVLALNVLDQFTLLGDHVGDLLEVLEMIRSQLLLLLHDVINFFVEGQQVLVHHGLPGSRRQCHSQIIHFGLAMLRRFPISTSRSWAWVPGTDTRGCISSWPCVGAFRCCHGCRVLWGSSNALSWPCIVPWTSIGTRVHWVRRCAPASALTLFPLQIVLATLPLTGDVLIDSCKRVRRCRLPVDVSISRGCLLLL